MRLKAIREDSAVADSIDRSEWKRKFRLIEKFSIVENPKMRKFQECFSKSRLGNNYIPQVASIIHRYHHSPIAIFTYWH